MGDRGNIVIETQSGEPKLYMYTHWTGSDLPRTVRDALVKGRDRWDDALYLNRVLFCAMVGNDDGITGYGIDTCYGDGGTEVYICHEAQTVRVGGIGRSFADYAALKDSAFA